MKINNENENKKENKNDVTHQNFNIRQFKNFKISYRIIMDFYLDCSTAAWSADSPTSKTVSAAKGLDIVDESFSLFCQLYPEQNTVDCADRKEQSDVRF